MHKNHNPNLNPVRSDPLQHFLPSLSSWLPFSPPILLSLPSCLVHSPTPPFPPSPTLPESPPTVEFLLFSTYTAASPAMPRDAEMIKIKNNPGQRHLLQGLLNHFKMNLIGQISHHYNIQTTDRPKHILLYNDTINIK
ncbi:hypothetical protein Pcinc_030840 [Petrolisthes cinctipes]|uniref:Uncharacterized protein n=1 Tax=Petrolisthes cinctipes TaxID=88211 RepID=A0AAE1EXW4_PETCI|nr:hypothetical protein Pcinc_030840 [Petrolisthes cinctipes]